MAQWITTWAAVFANHPLLRTAVDFVHIGGLVAAAGCALTADLATIAAARSTPDSREAQLRVLDRTHPIVVIGLAALITSGLLLLGADVSTYLHSTLFWIKMGLVGLLVINGALMLAAERRARRGGTGSWVRLHALAVGSLVLWTVTTLVGTALPNLT
jgi:uncharacterized membrane protein